MTEVCYEKLLPSAIVRQREACPVAYLPIGTIEWHGVHNPVGLDTLKIHALCVRCAERGGGLVFPALYYGESREEGLMEANSDDRDEIAALMGLPKTSFDPGYMRFSRQEQAQNYVNLLLHIMNEIDSLGFRVIVLAAGHYPLLDYARAACHLFSQQRYGAKRRTAVAWAFTGYELIQGEIEPAGDHAGFYETSLLMALCPGLVDLSALPADPKERLVGVGTPKHPRESNVEFGERAVSRIVELVNDRVQDRLKNPEAYRMHGSRLES